MNVVYVQVAAFLLASSAFGQEVPDYPVEKIGKQTYVIHGPSGFPSPENLGFMNNPVFTVTNDGVVVIDPGSSVHVGKMVMRQIRKITDKPITHVLGTHVHGDHWLGNHAFKEASDKTIFMAHPEMIARAKAGVAENWIQIMLDMTKGATKGTKAVIPETSVEDSSSFSTGGITFRVLAPQHAHSGTDIMIYIVEEGVLVLGDNVTHQRIGRLDDASFRGSINACDVALNTSAKVFVPGHGPTGDVSIVKKYRDYLATIYDSVVAMMESGMTDFEMKPKIVERLKDYHAWADFDALVGKHVSLAVLEAEKAAFE